MIKQISITAAISLIIIAALIGGVIGYGYGFSSAVGWGVKVGVALIKMDKINISIDEEMITRGIIQYKNNIGGCLFTNAPLHNN